MKIEGRVAISIRVILWKPTGNGLSVAVGINSGPVVGGVVGRRKFLYDLWGDTVTIARRLAGGEGAAIRVTSAVRDRVGEQFVLRGPVKLGPEGKSGGEAWEVTS